nr:TPA_asm: hypothetical protein HUJ06_022783 [Nelumbo nucifera]
MEPEIWSQLPEELLERVLAFLPLKNFFNLRCTCKRFNSLLFSPSFISIHSSVSSSSPLGDRAIVPPHLSPFLLLSHPQFDYQFPLYDSILGRWRNLSLSLTLPSSYVPAHLLSISNGLLCFSRPNSSSFLVCNLVSRSSRFIEFPAYPFSFEFLSLIPSSNGNGYKMFVLSVGSSSNTAFVYDSRANSWSQFESSRQILNNNSHQEGVLFDGHLYFTTPEPFSIVGFELETGKWARPIDAELPGELTFVRLVNSGEGKLYMVGGIGEHAISRSVKLWEWGEGNGWVEVQRLPEMMCRKFTSVCYHNYEHVYCFCHDGMVCVFCYTWPEILYYKVSTRSWHWLPKCPSLGEKWICGFRWFSFVPDLYTSV